MKKKVIALLLASVMALNFAACGTDDGAKDSGGNTSSDASKDAVTMQKIRARKKTIRISRQMMRTRMKKQMILISRQMMKKRMIRTSRMTVKRMILISRQMMKKQMILISSKLIICGQLFCVL